MQTMSTSFQPSGQLTAVTTHETMETQTGGQMVKSPPATVSQSFGVMLPPGALMQQQQQQRAATNLAYSENRNISYTTFTITDQEISSFPQGNIRLIKDEKGGVHPSLTRALLESGQAPALPNAQFQKFQTTAFPSGHEGLNNVKVERGDIEEKGMSPLSIASYQDGSQPSPSPSSQTRTQGLRYQVSGNPGDAMLSAINYNETDMLHDGGFDVSMPTTCTLPNLEEGILGNMATGTNVRLSENPGPPTFDLFDGDGNVAEPYNMESLSPQHFHDNNSGFGISDSASLSAVGEGDQSGGHVERRSSAESPVPGSGKGRNKGRAPKAGSPGRSTGVVCLICSKGFSNSSALAKHKLTHSDERKYICPICSKAFKRQDHLNGHMMTHRDKKPFECMVNGCEKSYCDARSLRRHMENHHNQQSSDANSIPSQLVGAVGQTVTQNQTVLTNSIADLQVGETTSTQAVYAGDSGGGSEGGGTGGSGGHILFTPSHTPYSPSPASTPHQSPGYANTQPHNYFQFEPQQQQQQQVPQPPPPPPPPPPPSLPQQAHFQTTTSNQVWQQEGGVIFVSPVQNSHSPRSGEQSPGYLQQISPISPAPTSPRVSAQPRAPWNQLAFNQQQQASDLMLKPGNLLQNYPLNNKPKKRRKATPPGAEGDENKPVQCSMCNRRFKNIPALNGHMRLHGGYFKKVPKDSQKEDKKKAKKELSAPSLGHIVIPSKLGPDPVHFKQPFQAPPHDQQNLQSPVQGGPFTLPPSQLEQDLERGQEQHSPLTPTHPPQHLASPGLVDQTTQQNHHRHVQQLLQQHIQMQSIQSLQQLQQQQQHLEQQQHQLQQLQEQLQHYQHQQGSGGDSPTSPSQLTVPSSPASLTQGEVLAQRAWQNADGTVSIHVQSPPPNTVTQGDPGQESRMWQEFTPQQEVVFQQQLQTMQDMENIQKQLSQHQVEQLQQQQQHHMRQDSTQVVTVAGGSPQQPYPILQQQLMLGLQSSSGDSLQHSVDHMTLSTTYPDVLPQTVHQDPLPSSLSNNIGSPDGLTQPVFVSAAPTGAQNFIGSDRQQDLTDAQLLTSVMASIMTSQHHLHSMDQTQSHFTANEESGVHASITGHPEVSLADVSLQHVNQLTTTNAVMYDNRLTENSTDPIMVNNSLHPTTTIEETLSMSAQPTFITQHNIDSMTNIKPDDDKLFSSPLHSRIASEISPFTFRPVHSESNHHFGEGNKDSDAHATFPLDRDKYLPSIGSTAFIHTDHELKSQSRKRHKSEGVISSAAKRSTTTNLALLLQKGLNQTPVHKPLTCSPVKEDGDSRSSKAADERNKLLQRSKSEDHTFMRPHSRVEDPYYRPRSRTDETILHRSRTHHDFLSRSDGAGVFRNPSLALSPIRVKKKHRPAPLIIPPHVNSCGFQSRLRSPRLWDGMVPTDGRIRRGNTPPPYTPPPMLSPVRSGSGLFWTLPPRFRPMTPKSAPIAPRFSLSRRGSLATGPVKADTIEEEPENEEQEEPPPETDILPHVNVGPQFQADIPAFNAKRYLVHHQPNKEDLVWEPSIIAEKCVEEDVQCYQEFACSAAVHGNGANVEYALHLLHLTGGNVQEAMLLLMKDDLRLPVGHSLLSYQYQEADIWNTTEIEAYYQALLKCDKDFFLISKEVSSKSCKECIQFYYLWKKVCPDEYKRLRIVRRKREHDELYNLRSKAVADQPALQGDAMSDSDSSSEEDRYPAEENQILDLERNMLTHTGIAVSPARSVTPPRASPSPVTAIFNCVVQGCTSTFTSKQALSSHTKLHGAVNHSFSVSPTPIAREVPHVEPARPPVSRPTAPQNILYTTTVTNTKAPKRAAPRTSTKKPPQPPQFNADGSIQIFPCKLCGKVFYKVKSRSAHMKSHREVDRKKPTPQPAVTR